MQKNIYTKNTSKDTMKVSFIVLRETNTTRLIFRPIWVSDSLTDNPLRGGFYFQKKSVNDEWEDVESLKISTLKKDESYQLNLGGEEISILLNELENIMNTLKEKGVKFGTKKYVLNEENSEDVILELSNIVDENTKNKVIEHFKNLENNNFENIENILQKAKLEKIIETFEENIKKCDESFWQNFFEENTWILQQVFVHPVLYIQGETYLGGKNTKGRNGSGGVVTDFLLKNISSNSICVVEIKTPCTDLINQSVYRGSGNGKNNDIHSTGRDLSGSVIQLENQIHEAINNFKTVIGSDESTKDVGILDPRGVLIIGTYSDLSDSQKRSFNLFRKSLSRDIVTFDELLEKMKMLLNIY